MTHLLLTGAGFTHNWKGWLAKEMEGDLLLRLRSNHDVRGRVQDADGFESALARMQLDVKASMPGAKEQYQALKKAILESFQEMNLALANLQTLEFSNERRFSVKGFLARFDAIYTLNQDLLFELLYDPLLEDRLPRRSCYNLALQDLSIKASFRTILLARRGGYLIYRCASSRIYSRSTSFTAQWIGWMMRATSW